MSDYDDSDDGYESDEDWIYMEDVFDEAVGNSIMIHRLLQQLTRTG